MHDDVSNSERIARVQGTTRHISVDEFETHIDKNVPVMTRCRKISRVAFAKKVKGRGMKSQKRFAKSISSAYNGRVSTELRADNRGCGGPLQTVKHEFLAIGGAG